jgi:hypothetical protein
LKKQPAFAGCFFAKNESVFVQKAPVFWYLLKKLDNEKI